MRKDQDSEVARFYENRSIFITGATGFIGKVLLEKLLRSCPGIRNIYILIRQKRGKSTEQRFEELMSSKIFDTLKRDYPEAFQKVVVVTGDMLLPYLGLSESDITEMTKTISIVFHTAACVKFVEPLMNAVDQNILGTRRVLELCLKLQRIEALVHVSTAYSNCNRNEIEEVIYPPPMSYQDVIELARCMGPDLMETITPKITGDRHNTYTFTKALTENLLDEERGSLPVAIVRPSVTSATWKEPFPGWIDSLNGCTGVILAVYKGLLRTFTCHGELVADIIPVDVLINVMTVVAWHTAVHRPNRIVVYHCTSGSTNKTTWSDMLRCTIQYSFKYPYTEVFWYPHTSFRRNPFCNKICAAFQHYLMAFLFDAVAYTFSRKPGMVRLYQKIHRATDCLHYFMMHEWKFHCDNILMLKNLLSEEDKQRFFLDVQSLNWDVFWENHALGLRKFVLKEDPSTIPAARKNIKMRYALFQIGKVVVLVTVAWKFLFSKFL